MPGRKIEVVPLLFPEFDREAKAGSLDFILTNPGHYVLLRNRYGASAIATQITLTPMGASTEFAGLIFARTDRGDIQDLESLAGKRIAAVGDESLGGFMMQRWELEKRGIRTSQFVFTGMPQDNVVDAVLSRKSDAGFVRTGMLEKLVAEGKLSLQDVKVLNPITQDGFPMLHSTDTYPEWPVVVTQHLPHEIAQAISIALLSLKPTDLAAKAAGIAGFTTPADYTSVESLMLRISQHPDELKKFNLADVVARYEWPLLGVLTAMLGILGMGGLLLSSNRRLTQASISNRVLLDNLNASESLYHGLFENMSSGVMVCEAMQGTADFLIRDFNRAAEEMEGIQRQQVIGQRLSRVFPTASATGLDKVLERVCANGKGEHFLFACLNRQGVMRWRKNYVYRLGTGQVVVIADDVTPQKQAEMALKDSHDTLQRLLDSMVEGAYGVDINGNCTFVNRSFMRMLGYQHAEELLGKHIHELIHHSYPDGTPYPGSACKLHHASHQRQVIDVSDEVFWRKDGTSIPVEYWAYPIEKDGYVIGSIATFIDITERKRVEDDIRSLAFYDTLTQLPNRRMLNDRLQFAMSASKRSGQYGAVMFMDMDNFKPLNDQYGHVAGDLMLVEVAQRITDCVRAVDTVARFGGDEFVVVVSDLGSSKNEANAQAALVADKIRSRLAEPYLLCLRQEDENEQEITHQCTSSIGVILFLNHDKGVEEILKLADMAMYQAKESGRNQVRFIDAESFSAGELVQ